MKIAIGTNIFGSFHRQDTCIQSLQKLKNMYPDMIDLYNLQPEEAPEELDGFTTLKTLKRTCQDLVEASTKHKPLLRDMFDSLADLEGYDYFIFTNSDIIVSDRFIKLILNNQDYDSFSGARLTIEDINDISDTPKLIQYQVAGFDTFAVKSEWWRNNKESFPEYIYAEPCWDVHYATIFKKLGKSMFVNKWPAAIFHVHHDIAWSDMTPERIHNETMLFKTYKDDSDMWHRFLFQVLLRRTPHNGFYNPFDNEEKLEDQYFHA